MYNLSSVQMTISNIIYQKIELHSLLEFHIKISQEIPFLFSDIDWSPLVAQKARQNVVKKIPWCDTKCTKCEKWQGIRRSTRTKAKKVSIDSLFCNFYCEWMDAKFGHLWMQNTLSISRSGSKDVYLVYDLHNLVPHRDI